MHAVARPTKLSPTQVLPCNAMIVTLSMRIRHSFGRRLQPNTMDPGWSRETFALVLGAVFLG